MWVNTGKVFSNCKNYLYAYPTVVCGTLLDVSVGNIIQITVSKKETVGTIGKSGVGFKQS